MTPRLRSLELHGYKTFASRTLLEFSGDITAIVGPNGSGKSNVADAIRWVLGEQSYSLLRGRRTEDMIFAGSEYRPRASMASASILLDNTDGWLPIDFSEVGITRRAYRDGDNEYLINGSRVRLKDTSELLAQSGLAERTYTIIGQGLVDVALSLKPEERRRFFEEAAGIGLYRSRREETLNRLETTTRNLERVLDILTELEPRLASLEKQAKRVIEYEQVRADLKLLLRDWYGYHWHKSQQDLNYALEVLRQQDEKTSSARERVLAVESQVSVIRNELQVVREDLNGWHSQSAAVHSQLEQVSRSLAVLDERQRANKSLTFTLTTDLERLITEEQGLLELLTNLESEKDRLNADAVESETQLASAQRALAERQQARAAIEIQIRETRQQQVTAGTQSVQKKARLEEVTNRLLETRRSLDLTKSSLQTEQAELQSAEDQLSTIQTEAKQVKQSVLDMEDYQTGMDLRLNSLEKENRATLDERRQLDTQRARLTAQLEVLEQAEQALTGISQGSQAVILAARSGKLKGGFRSVAGLIDVPADYETAIAAAMGDMLDAVLLDLDVSLEDVFQMFNSDDSARAVLITPSKTRKNLKSQKQISGAIPALDVVKLPASGGDVLEILLSNVFIVENRREALGIISQLDTNSRVVTKAGEVFWGNGLMALGKEKRTSVVSRSRQIREMQEQLHQTQSAIDELDSHIRKQEGELEGLRAEINNQKGKLRQIQQVLEEKNQQATQLNLKVEKLRQSVVWKINQISLLESQLLNGEEEVSALEVVLTALERDSEQAGQKLKELNDQMRSLPLDDLQAQVGHWTTSQAVTARALNDSLRRIAEHTERIEGNRQRQVEEREKLHTTETTLTSLESEKASLRQQEHQLGEQVKTLQSQIEPAESKLLELESNYAAIQEELALAQQALSTADRFAGQAQQDVSRHRERLETLHDKIEEDFGLVSMEQSTPMATAAPLPMDGVEELPTLTELPPQLAESIARQRSQLRRLGPINPDAHREYVEVKERFDFLTTQVADLKKASLDMKEVIAELDVLMQQEFRKTFHAVAEEFRHMFSRLFGGGSARLVLQDEENPIEAGIDIEARLPGRREQGLSLLSGGERSLTAVALIFSLIKVSPTPFCVLDEVDAALDEANVGRFTDLLKELSVNTQFIVITHNRNTVQVADVIYGVTMSRDSASQVISLRLDEVGEDMVR